MKTDTHKIMVMDMRCAFLSGKIQRSVFSSCRTSIPVWVWYDGGETKEGHVRNTRCDTDVGWGRSVNLGSSRMQRECLAAVYNNFEKDVIVVVHASAQVMGRPSRSCMWC